MENIELFQKKIENYFMHTTLLLLQHIQILMKNIIFSSSYGNFCMCTKHFPSHYKGDAKSKREQDKW